MYETEISLPTQMKTIISSKVKILIPQIKLCVHHSIYKITTSRVVPDSLMKYEVLYPVTECWLFQGLCSYLTERINKSLMGLTLPITKQHWNHFLQAEFLSRWGLVLWDELRWHTGPHCWPLLVFIVSVSQWDNKIPACLK